MTTITETPKSEVVKKYPSQSSVPQLPPPPARPVSECHPLFSDSLLEKSSGERKRKTFTAMFSFALQCIMLGVLVIIPLLFTEGLPKAQLLTFLVAPPPPPPPPPPPAAAPVKVIRQTDLLDTGALRTPTRIPKKVEMIKEEEAPPPAPVGGVVGGVPGGIPGGQLGGVIGGIISDSRNMAAVPKLEPPKRIRVSQGVTQGLRIHYVEPIYPRIAQAARITGVVQLHAVIGKDGTIHELEAISGHPMLIQAAIEAVKQWRYRPYLLNGEAVEVDTNITVSFQISGN
jgi:periplasmic protein TonB